MELFFDDINPAIGQTHVLIIAVGNYPYLRGGAKANPTNEMMGLGQLTSPQKSAFHLLNAIMDLHERNDWIRPLGSVELLVSSTEYAELPSSPCIENVRSAYNGWFNRCDSNSDNVCLFYFCGHGLEKYSQYLLVEDFGENPRNPWSGAFSFDQTRRAFHKCRAQTQLFLIDACRLITSDMLEEHLIVAPLDQANFLIPDCKYDLTIKATATNEAAYGTLKGPSFFSQAVVHALTGSVATKDTNEWKIWTNNIAAHINNLLQSIDGSGSDPQRCVHTGNDSVAIIRLSDPPMVVFEVGCDPSMAQEDAHLSYEHVIVKENTASREPAPDAWLVTVEAGIYKVDASFKNVGTYKNVTSFTSVMPPFAHEKLKCHG